MGATLAALADEGMPVVAVDAGDCPELAHYDGEVCCRQAGIRRAAVQLRHCRTGSILIDVAAGLSLSGNIAFTGSFAVFGTGRAYDQIRNTVCYSNLNVKITPTHAGVSVGPDGGSHQMLEDVALMRVLPRVKGLPSVHCRLPLGGGGRPIYGCGSPRGRCTCAWVALRCPACTKRVCSWSAGAPM